MKDIIKRFCLLAVVGLLVSCQAVEDGAPGSAVVPSKSPITEEAAAAESGLAPYQGQWAAYLDEFGECALNVNADIHNPYTLLSVSEWGVYLLPVEWSVEDGRLSFWLNNQMGDRITVRLALQEEEFMAGTWTQNGYTDGVVFHKVSEQAEKGAFYKTYSREAMERIEQLEQFSTYRDDGVSIPFTYALGQREGSWKTLELYGLDELTEGAEDIELMTVLLNWVCDHFVHDGASGMPEQRDMVSVMEYARQNGGVNCRGLSIILAELCRIYGIEAKHITCMPREADFDECHVVVHAFSERYTQWVMLDPTYRLIPQNERGVYMNLPMLRESYLDGTALVPNKGAGWNGSEFDPLEYQGYMAKNTFRFSCATDFYFGAEDGVAGNIENMLVPEGYTEDAFGRTTTWDVAFWALPAPTREP